MKKNVEATSPGITSLSATEMARLIARGELSSREVVEAHIRRIEAVNLRLNALVVPLFERAREEAARADQAREQGQAVGPLHGVPITLKEQMIVAETATTVGIISQREHLMHEEGPLVRRLRQAGAIILGTTNVAQLLMYHESDNPVYGRTGFAQKVLVFLSLLGKRGFCPTSWFSPESIGERGKAHAGRSADRLLSPPSRHFGQTANFLGKRHFLGKAGRTNNPWDLARTPGGSSGGEAAMIAAGGSPLGLGGDFGGSIRVPAHFCGLYSLLPTARRLTHLDTAPHAYISGQEAIIAQPCPIARTVSDLRLAMRILAAPGLETLDPAVPPVPWPDATDSPPVSLRGVRIGFFTDNGLMTVAPAVRRAVEEAAQALREQGAVVEPWSPPDGGEAARLYIGLVGADGFAAYKRHLGREQRDARISFNLRISGLPTALRTPLVALLRQSGQAHLADALQRIRGALTVDQYWSLVQERNRYRSQFLADLDAEQIDAILCPPHALPALTHGSGGILNVATAGSYAILANVLGLPAGVAPITYVRADEESERHVGRDRVERRACEVEKGSAGLPVGVQVIARHWREDLVLAILAALEGHTSQHTRAFIPDFSERPA